MNVAREQIVDLEMIEGELIAFGLRYPAECGCVVQVGVLMSNDEMAATYQPCQTHTPFAREFMERFPGPDGPEIPTELWIGQLLDEIGMVI